MTSTDNVDLLQQEGWKDGTGGDNFYTREFGPNGWPRAVVLFLHGMMEHSGRYVDVFF
ncbi:hypothetical protein M422DRAFT_26965 [Sphaerobolus stellatus SS14]|nr:hypothetical protein M422DRAFT_26965 [Sphaerobolus stellatus SS14]